MNQLAENSSSNDDREEVLRMSQKLEGSASDEYLSAYNAPGFVGRIRAGVDEQLKKTQFEMIGLMALAYELQEKGLTEAFLENIDENGTIKVAQDNPQWEKLAEKLKIKLSKENLSVIHAHLSDIKDKGAIKDVNGSAKILKLRDTDYNPIFIRHAYNHIITEKKPNPPKRNGIPRELNENDIENHILYYEGITEEEIEIIRLEAPYWGIECKEKPSVEIIKGVFRAIAAIKNLPKEVKEKFNITLDGYLLGHLMRVGLLNGMLAQGLNDKAGKIITKPEMAALAGTLHDIGKSLPNLEPFIKTDRKLNNAEYESVKLHSPLTYAMLFTLRKDGHLSELSDEEFELACSAALWHHVRPDGHEFKSYPKKHPTTGEVLDHNNIPDIGKINSVSDIYDAIASRRGYDDREGDPNEIAVGQLEDEEFKGKQTDAKMVDAFLELGVEHINFVQEQPSQ